MSDIIEVPFVTVIVNQIDYTVHTCVYSIDKSMVSTQVPSNHIRDIVKDASVGHVDLNIASLIESLCLIYDNVIGYTHIVNNAMDNKLPVIYLMREDSVGIFDVRFEEVQWVNIAVSNLITQEHRFILERFYTGDFDAKAG